jgi:hypothetical protein
MESTDDNNKSKGLQDDHANERIWDVVGDIVGGAGVRAADFVLRRRAGRQKI